MPHTALITGASTGIGYELSKCFAADKYDLVLVARRKQKLEEIGQELQSRHGIKVTVIARDLAKSESPQVLYDELAKASLQIDVLVNNAGFGLGGKFTETDVAVELEMVQLNIATLIHLSKLFLPGMIERKIGGILNLASTAAFQPGPLMAVYYATKAFVLSFSEAIANEVHGTGVTVTALCPGPTASEFQQRAQIKETRLVKLKPMGLMSAQAVAQTGYQGFKQGKRVVIPGLLNKIGVQSTRFSPRRVTTQIARMLQES